MLLVYVVVLWVVLVVLLVKELLFCYMLCIVECVCFSMLVVNVWYVCLDVVFFLVVVLGIVGSLVGFILLDLVVVVVVGLMVVCIGWGFFWSVLYDLMDCVVFVEEGEVICVIIFVMFGV